MTFRLFPVVVSLAAALAGSPSGAAELPQPIRVILVGDSTMASGSGYGDALCARFVASVKCINLARGGRSTSTFRNEGRWADVETLLRDGSAFDATYVLIQFGHNDQPGKGERSTDLVTGFGPNMARYASETKALGGVPVLVTPLARRSFKGAYLKDTLGPWAEATRKAAARENAALLDLHADSIAAVQAMGPNEADTLAVAPPESAPSPADPNRVEVVGAPKGAFDYTHVGPKGAALFARMVEAEFTAAIPSIKPYFKQ
ncbi:rhamnogalacturonan acetylesterase [Massilia forsythiae]|uniref:Rhamnogalacturonan acetylesterase n=1 Tax=Massilia forsythiae TaxID=2728020 RepID=A0A7Z2ZVG2_9BURK|nr:rhamnogalacturonan acetylesterase [Massilia forsythiae]QJE02052.1 rhamnogalacturonan acetylesterase [Massilia forsythiae]